MSRHAFARAAAPSPPLESRSQQRPTDLIANLSAPPGLRGVQAADLSHRPTHSVDAHPNPNVHGRMSSEFPPTHLLSQASVQYPGRQPSQLPADNGPLFHLPGSSGQQEGSALTVLAPQPRPPNAMGQGSRPNNSSPQQGLLSRLGILESQVTNQPKPGAYDRVGQNVIDNRLPHQQHYGTPSFGRGNGPVGYDERIDPLTAISNKDGRYSQPQSATSSTFSPSPVGGSNPSHVLAAKGSRLAKFFDSPGEGIVSPPLQQSGNQMHGRPSIPPQTPPIQMDDSRPDLLAYLRDSQQQTTQQPAVSPVSLFISHCILTTERRVDSTDLNSSHIATIS